MIDSDEIIPNLLSDQKSFNDFVYTPANEAVVEIERRRNDPLIDINLSLPEVFDEGPKAVLYVAVITPNFQIRRYVQLAKDLNIEPLIFEQLEDKFTSNNQWKHSLGKMSFFIGKGKKGGTVMDHLNVINFNASNGESIQSVKTLWGESLIDFHHGLFFKTFPQLNERNLFDASEWLLNNGTGPREYYEAFLTLMIKNGIQFENFYLNEKENFFTKEIFLPAFINVLNKTGLKPLIVELEPPESEGDEYWYSHPSETKVHVEASLGKV